LTSTFWKGKRVFLTGHTGFKGGWLALWLSELGAEVTGFALDVPTQPSFFETARLSTRMRDLRGDVRHFPEVKAAMAAGQPEVVIHMAAQSLVRRSYAFPVETYSTNVMGTVHVLQAAREITSIRSILVVTSDKCYENREWSRGYRETDPLGGRDPYSSSKGCQEIVTSAFRASFFNGQNVAALASARAGNVIGGGDWAEDRLVPDAIRAFEAGKVLEIRNPDAVRPWQHVLDPLAGYMMLAEKLFDGEREFASSWNFGPLNADAQTVRSVADLLVQLWGDGVSWTASNGAHVHEAGLLMLDCTKANKQLQWMPKWSLARALQAVVDWHRAFGKGEDMQSFSLRQIADYCACETARENADVD